MDSKSGKHRRNWAKRRPGGASPKGSRGRSRPKSVAPTNSFAPPPAPSRGTIKLPDIKREPPVFKVFLAGFCGVFLLILSGGGHHASALGFALLLPGLVLAIKPPERGLGKLGDFGVFGLLACLLLAFIPQFYWPTADWRVEAVESFGLLLPSMLSVQPWISLEAWLMAVAGFSWFYVALQWKINLPGRRWLFFSLSILLSLMAGIVVWGNLYGMRYPGAEEAEAFSFFPSRTQTVNFLVLGGIATFAYAMEGVRTRNILPLVGVPASGLCLAGLFLSGSPLGVLLYFAGIGLWFAMSLRVRSWPRALKIGLPLFVLVFSIALASNERAVERIKSFTASEAQFEEGYHAGVFEDTKNMVLDAPLTGFGLGTFSAIFPQYREASADHLPASHPKSDLFLLASEGGLLAVGFLLVFLIGYALRCRGITEGGSATYRLFALVAVVIFLLHGLVDVSAHRPGTVYFAILFAALALPNRERPRFSMPTVFWKLLGAVLIIFGSMWLTAGVFNLPWHSSTRVDRYQEEIRSNVAALDFTGARSGIDDWLALRPLEWRAYLQRAEITLSDTVMNTDAPSEAAADFMRARFVEPILGIVTYEEGVLWLSDDPERAISAWRETLLREMEDMNLTYERMLEQATSREMRERMARLSEMSPHYRARFLTSLENEMLTTEMRRELAKDPALSGFDRAQRAEIVEHWVENGDLESAGAFISEHGDSFENSWWLRSLVLKNQAEFEEAVEKIRENIDAPEVVEVQLDEAGVARLMREYAVAPTDVVKGTSLVHMYLGQDAYEKALPILGKLAEAPEPQSEILYWQAESLYQVRDYIGSWYTFEKYFNRLRDRN